jgi:hypothetical protein
VQAREKTGGPIGGLAGWIWEGIVRRRMQGRWPQRWIPRRRQNERPGPRLRLVERIALAPRQSLALVEAEGRRFLVATSAEGGPAFYALDERAGGKAAPPPRRPGRRSW